MRQYRGLTKDGKWVYGSYTHVHDVYGNPSIIPIEKNIFVSVILGTVGQQTGLKDWCAGDIIQKGEIIRAITVDWEHGMRFMLGKHILCKQDAVNGTKIGNIHQNPELMEQDNESKNQR